MPKHSAINFGLYCFIVRIVDDGTEDDINVLFECVDSVLYLFAQESET
jgi:hypothetical protein